MLAGSARESSLVCIACSQRLSAALIASALAPRAFSRLASVLPVASYAAFDSGAFCRPLRGPIGAPRSRGAWLCVFAGPSIYSASHGRSLGRTLRSCSDLLSGDPGAALLV